MTPTTRPAPGFPGYFASDDGRVFSTRPWRGSTEPRELTGGPDSAGYRMVTLMGKWGVRERRYVHQLVAEVFLGRRPKGKDVRHLDGDKSNNAVSNLAYGSRSENLRDAVRHGTHYNAKKTHCPRRHRYTKANTYISPTTGERSCRTCRRTSDARRGLSIAVDL